MGVTYVAYAAIGVRVPRSKLFQGTRKVRAFEHNYAEDVKFCPKTGQKCWREKTVPIVGLTDARGKEWDEDSGESINEANFHGYPIVTPCSTRSCESPLCRDVVIALTRAKAAEWEDGLISGAMRIPTPSEEQEFRQKLELAGLLAGPIALHAVAYVSY